ncbi:MAG: hypothetical protein Q7S22_05585 [Candidatus Micrarchaeota archaeon]|nr:hypothetical protein [Candidatus Micrarchaeota archaeon]
MATKKSKTQKKSGGFASGKDHWFHNDDYILMTVIVVVLVAFLTSVVFPLF